MLGQHSVDLCLILRIDITQNNALQRRQTSVHAEPLQDGSKPRLDPQAVLVLDATILDVDPQKQLAVALLVPADVIIDAGHFRRMRFRKSLTVVLFYHRLELRSAPVGNQILQTSSFAIFAISKVALHLHDGFAHAHNFFRRGKANPLSQRRECLFGRRCSPHAATGQNVIADDFAVLNDGHQAQILRVQVDAVVVRQTNRHLEFTRQVASAVDGFFNRLEFRNVDLFAVFILQPDIKIGGRLRTEMFGQFLRQLLNLVVNVRLNRCRAGHHVSIHVAAGSKRCQLNIVDGSNGFFQVAFQDSVQLKSLAAGDSQCAVGQLFAQIQFGQKLTGGDSSTGNSSSDHAGILLAERLAVFTFGLARISVVLKIRAVMLQQCGRVIRKFGFAIQQFFGQRSTKLVRRIFQQFDLAEFHFFRHLSLFRW